MESRGMGGVEALIQQGYTVKIGEYIKQGWELFKKNAWGYIGFTLVYFLFGLIIQQLDKSAAPLGSVVNIALSGPLAAGWYIVAFKQLRNRIPEFGDFFKGFNNYLTFFLISLVAGILIGLGMILLILPGIYLAVAYLFATAFAVSQRMDFWTAMEASRKLITKKWFSFFGFVLVLFLLNFVGALALGIGLFVTIPVSACAIAAAYADIVGLSAEVES
jgi:uncharacterized membrane protein